MSGSTELQNQLLNYILNDTYQFNPSFIPIINDKFTDKITDNLSYIGHTALTLACTLNKSNQFKILIKNSADINIGDQFNNTPLHIALHYNNNYMIGLLINTLSKINVNKKNNDGVSPFMFAIKHNKQSIVSYLIKIKNVNIDMTDNNGNTPLHEACSISNINIINILLKANANINAQDNNGRTPLFNAILKKNLVVIKLLLDNGANVNVGNKKNNYPLHEACNINDIYIVNQLLLVGANINAQNNDGKSPIYFAIKKKSIDIIKLLIKNKVNINIKDKNNDTVLHYICALKDINLLPFIYVVLKAGARINEQNKSGDSPIIYIISFNNIPVLKFLIRQKIDIININIKNIYDETPLYHTCFYKNTEIIQLLLQNGADPTIITKDKSTILHMICYEIDYVDKDSSYDKDNDSSDNIDIKNLELILNTQAVSLINNINDIEQTPLSIICEKKKNINIIKLLLDYGANPNIIIQNYSLFFMLIEDEDINNINIIKLLFEYDININIQDIYGNTPLIYACTYNNNSKYYDDIIKLLLSNTNIDINKTNKYNHTPLYIACKKLNINKNTIKSLIEHNAKLSINNNLSIYNELDITIFDILIKYRYFSLDAILTILNFIENKIYVLYIIHIFIFYNQHYDNILKIIIDNTYIHIL